MTELSDNHDSKGNPVWHCIYYRVPTNIFMSKIFDSFTCFPLKFLDNLVEFENQNQNLILILNQAKSSKHLNEIILKWLTTEKNV